MSTTYLWWRVLQVTWLHSTRTLMADIQEESYKDYRKAEKEKQSKPKKVRTKTHPPKKTKTDKLITVCNDMYSLSIKNETKWKYAANVRFGLDIREKFLEMRDAKHSLLTKLLSGSSP